MEGFRYNGAFYFPRPVTINDIEYPYPYKLTKLWGYYIWGAPEIIKKERKVLLRYRKLLEMLLPNPIMPDVIFTKIPAEFPHSGQYSFQEEMEIVMTVYVSWKEKEGAPALPHELAHHVYILLPEETKEKTYQLWKKIKNLENFQLLAEGRVLRDIMPHAGHPWDGPEEMFASALHLLQLGQGLPQKIAEEIIKQVLGKEVIEVMKR